MRPIEAKKSGVENYVVILIEVAMSTFGLVFFWSMSWIINTYVQLLPHLWCKVHSTFLLQLKALGGTMMRQ